MKAVADLKIKIFPDGSDRQGMLGQHRNPFIKGFQAEAAGCPIITATQDILKKLFLVGRDLQDYCVETVKMFYDDARKAHYSV